MYKSVTAVDTSCHLKQTTRMLLIYTIDYAIDTNYCLKHTTALKFLERGYILRNTFRFAIRIIIKK